MTPIGGEVLDQLARRGAQIIALVPSLSDPIIQELVPAIREATKNELIYAEECDLGSPTSIREFCKRLVQPQPSMDGQGRPEPSRLDAVITMHEYPPNVPESVMNLPASDFVDEISQRRRASTATFLLTTLLLPSLLRAPSDRDIRFISVVNPLYAAAIPKFDPARDAESTLPPLSKEGYRSLRSIILGRHLQRVFDALVATTEKAPAGPLPDPSDASATPIDRVYKGSNIISTTVSPGYHSQYTRQLVLLSNRFKRFGRLNSIIFYPIL